jgi:hypothetical protein
MRNFIARNWYQYYIFRINRWHRKMHKRLQLLELYDGISIKLWGTYVKKAFLLDIFCSSFLKWLCVRHWLYFLYLEKKSNCPLCPLTQLVSDRVSVGDLKFILQFRYLRISETTRLVQPFGSWCTVYLTPRKDSSFKEQRARNKYVHDSNIEYCITLF